MDNLNLSEFKIEDCVTSENKTADVQDPAPEIFVVATPELCMAGNWQSWIQAKQWSELEAVLPEFLRQRRWFGGKTRSIEHVHIAEALAIAIGGTPTLFVAEISYAEGPGDSYHIPLVFVEGPELDAIVADDPGAVLIKTRELGTHSPAIGALVDGFRSREFCRSLLRLIEQPCEMGMGSVKLSSRAASWFPEKGALEPAALVPRVLTSEQSNTSVIFGQQLILKMFRRVTPGRNPELEIGLSLTESGFPNSPRVAGWLEYGSDEEKPRVLALLHEYVPSTRDAWEFTREQLKGYFNRVLDKPSLSNAPKAMDLLVDLSLSKPSGLLADLLGSFPDLAELLGRRTAQLHLALSADHKNQAFAPEPYGAGHQRSEYQSMRNLEQETLRQLRLSMDSLPVDLRTPVAELLSEEPGVLERFDAFQAEELQALRIRIHGDYHLGQVLYTGSDFLIIDFEGEPNRTLEERLQKRSVLRDLAGMIRSFHYAVQSTLLEINGSGTYSVADRSQLKIWADLWHNEVSRAFLRGYMATASGASFLPTSQSELSCLLQAFLLEKALYEISYELNSRPSWLRIPLSGIRKILREPS